MKNSSKSPPPGSFAKLMASDVPKDRSPSEAKLPAEVDKSSLRDTTQPRHHGIKTPRYQDSTIEAVRKAVREFGKEAATHRFTSEEKKAIADIVHTYRKKGIRTSENQIARISVNFVVRDYEENGASSFLAKVLKVLNR